MKTQFDEQHDETMTAMLRAVETAPEVNVPDDFTQRVMARVPKKAPLISLRRARALTPQYGRTSAYAAIAVVLAIMLLVAKTHGVTSVGSGLQLVLVLQLCAYVLWMGFASWRSH